MHGYRRWVRGPIVRRAGLLVVRLGKAAPVGLWPGEGHPQAGWHADAAAAPAGRCGSCRATHVLLPSWSVTRRADAAGVIASAAVASALHGTGAARIGAQLGVPAATVRGWLRRLRSRAGAMRQDAMTIFGRITGGRDAPYPEPSGSPLGDALAAVAACAHAAVAFCGRTAADWEPLLGLFGLARFLAPAPGS